MHPCVSFTAKFRPQKLGSPHCFRFFSPAALPAVAYQHRFVSQGPRRVVAVFWGGQS